MIVITTYNGYKFLKDLLYDIQKYDIINEEICIVDNGSNNKDHIEYLTQLKETNYNVLFNPYGGYNLGGYKYALDHLKANEWFCMQDSIRIKQDIFSKVKPLLTNKNVYTFLSVKSGAYDNDDDKNFLMKNFGTTYYSKMMFPSSYFALNEVLQKAKLFWIYPKNKVEAMAMERGACIIFDRLGVEINGLGEYDPPKTGDPEGYPHFYKIYGGRN